MPYYIDAKFVSLDDLRRRIEATDLVPSRASLLDGIEVKFQTLKKQGLTTLAAVRNALKSAKRLADTAEASGIDQQYLVLLRREIEGWFPKPFPLKDFDWLPGEEIAKLEAYGIRDTAGLYEAAEDDKSPDGLAKTTGVDAAVLDELLRLADLTRVQWMSPKAARIVAEAGCDSPAKLAAADVNELSEALRRINAGDKYFKGQIGLRDVKRLVMAAGYVAGRPV